jgi:hypothetical protein
MPRPVRALLALVLLAAPLAVGCASDPAPGPSPDSVRELDLEALAIDGGRMLDHVDRQMEDPDTGELRYRTPGTEGHEATVPALEGLVEDAGLEAETQRYRAELPGGLGEVNLTNVYGVREGQDPEAGEIWVAAHWDSRAWADRETEDCEGPPVPGANDGAAAVASAVHVAEVLPPTQHTVRVALFDAEDQGCEGEGWATGSQHAADRLAEAGELDRVEAMVLVDMPADDDLTVYRERYSDEQAPRLTNLAFAVADVAGAEAFVNETGSSVLDDHVPFLENGVPAVDLVHNDPEQPIPFPDTWHTTEDTRANLDAGSLEQATRVAAGTVLGIDAGLHEPEGS